MFNKMGWKFIVYLPLILFGLSCFGQFTTVTATVTDSDSQTWNNCTWNIKWVPNGSQSNPNIYTINGTSITSNTYNSYLNQSGTCNGSGALSLTVLDNTQINPVGSQWVFTVQSNTSAPATQYLPLTISGSSINLSDYLSINSITPRFPAIPTAYGYLDAEIKPIPNQGAYYFNVTTLVDRQWNGFAWQDFIGGNFCPLIGCTMTGILGINVTNPATPSWISPSYQQSMALPINSVFNGISTLTQPYPYYMPLNINASFTATGQNLGNPGVGPGGWSEHRPFTLTAENNAPGWLINFHTLTQAAPGDFADRYDIMTMYGGMLAGSDEGTHVDGGQLSEPTSVYTGTVTTGGGSGTTSLKVSCSTDCNNPGDDRDMLDTNQVVLTGSVTSYTAATSNTPETYDISISTGSMPSTTAIGTLGSACGPSSSQWPVGAQTVTVSCAVTVSSGTFAVNDWVTFSTTFHEVAQVTAVTPLSSGSQTLTFNLRHAHAAGPIYANGCAGCYVVFTANLGNGTVKYPITVVSGTSSTMLTVPFAVGTGISANFKSYTANLSHGGSQAFTVYRGAQVLDVQDAANNYAIDGTFTVEPTPTTWNTGDTIEVEHGSGYQALAHDFHFNLQNPGAIQGSSNGTVGSWAAYTTWLNGTGFVGQGYGEFLGDINSLGGVYLAENQTATSAYTYLRPPSFLKAEGAFDGLLESQYAPYHGAIYIGCWQTGGCSASGSYYLYQLAGIPYFYQTWTPSTGTLELAFSGNGGNIVIPNNVTFTAPGANLTSLPANPSFSTVAVSNSLTTPAFQSGLATNLVDYSESFNSGGWSQSPSADITVTPNPVGITPPSGSTSVVTELQWTANAVLLDYPSGYTITVGSQYLDCIWMRTPSGTADIAIGVQYNVLVQQTVTSTWTEFCQTTTANNLAGNTAFAMGNVSATPTIYVAAAEAPIPGTVSPPIYYKTTGTPQSTPIAATSPVIPPPPVGGLAFTPTTSSNSTTTGDVVTQADTTGGVQDSGTALSSLCQSNGTHCPTPTRGEQALISGTTTISTSAACAVGSSCIYKLTNCGVNASTAIGTLSVSTITAGTSFVVNSLSAANTTVTGDASTVCWQIN